jgi:hypothetical protein
MLAQAWESMVDRGGIPAARQAGGAVDPTVIASWERSACSVSPDLAAAPVDDADNAVEQWHQSEVAARFRAIEGDVREIVEDGDFVGALTDSTGRLVWTACTDVTRRSAERMNFVPGGRWDEASVGTNALGLALQTGKAATIYTAEHFSRAMHGWACYSSPLRDPATDDVLGVISLSTTWDRANPLALGAARALGRLVTSTLPLQRTPSDAPLRLSVLGTARVTLGPQVLALPRRQLEILVLLTMHPEGLSLEALHAQLYGDAAVTMSTLKGEISRLRSALGGAISSPPYRLTCDVTTDVLRLMGALERGDLTEAVGLYGAPLMPLSESPGVTEWRDYVEVALRSAVLASCDAGTAQSFADRYPYDDQVQQHLVDLLPASDPRRHLAVARLHRAING